MGQDCCGSGEINNDTHYRKVLWYCLIANAAMFILQTVGSYEALSVSLLANALDFLSDAANYGISLFVLAMSIRAKSYASLFKGASLGLVGMWVAFETYSHALIEQVPQPFIMIVISFLGLAVNVICAVLLYKFRAGDSNRESVWICSRNDAIGNMAVIVAAAGVFASHTAWPDIIVAAILGILALSGAGRIINKAMKELKQTTDA